MNFENINSWIFKFELSIKYLEEKASYKKHLKFVQEYLKQSYSKVMFLQQLYIAHHEGVYL